MKGTSIADFAVLPQTAFKAGDKSNVTNAKTLLEVKTARSPMLSSMTLHAVTPPS